MCKHFSLETNLQLLPNYRLVLLNTLLITPCYFCMKTKCRWYNTYSTINRISFTFFIQSLLSPPPEVKHIKYRFLPVRATQTVTVYLLSINQILSKFKCGVVWSNAGSIWINLSCTMSVKDGTNTSSLFVLDVPTQASVTSSITYWRRSKLSDKAVRRTLSVWKI